MIKLISHLPFAASAATLSLLTSVSTEDGRAISKALNEAYDAGTSARSQVAALQAELAECKRDAERYRYWRDNHGWTGYFDDGASNEDSPKAVDAAIDAAMKEGE